ncbi:hypothetical protein [Novosphingobium sp. BL-52-GroH]|uniref:hypothetical protein n=1 Tax=Novosphingobium sp. BL-52-GroH TaxID=3349877 RepID=UPI00384CA085
MTTPSSPNPPQPRSDAGIATAEDGLVVLDGPNGVAVTMTAEAAAQTGRNLIDASLVADRQIAEKTVRSID